MATNRPLLAPLFMIILSFTIKIFSTNLDTEKEGTLKQEVMNERKGYPSPLCK
jgi:hypothetical protein